MCALQMVNSRLGGTPTFGFTCLAMLSFKQTCMLEQSKANEAINLINHYKILVNFT